jgi:ribosomal-protein-alanine N-acetyltransferase
MRDNSIIFFDKMKKNKNESEIILRVASSKDAAAFISIEKKVKSSIYFSMGSEEEFIEALGKRKIYIIERRNEIIGHISYEKRNDGSIYFHGFAIVPEYQGKGFGRKALELIREVVEDAFKIDMVTHPDNFKAIELYKSLGFKIVGQKENYFGDGQPRVILEKYNQGIEQKD